MNRKRYLQELSYHLRALPKDVRDDIIDIYEEQFDGMEQEGHSEEEMILLIGRAKQNAEKELAIHADQIESEPSETKKDRETFDANKKPSTERTGMDSSEKVNVPILILLIIVNLMFVLGPAIAVLAIGLFMWLASILLMATPLIAYWAGYLLTFPALYPILAAVGLGILLFVALHYLAKLVSQLVTIYFNGMKRIVKG